MRGGLGRISLYFSIIKGFCPGTWRLPNNFDVHYRYVYIIENDRYYYIIILTPNLNFFHWQDVANFLSSCMHACGNYYYMLCFLNNFIPFC